MAFTSALLDFCLEVYDEYLKALNIAQHRTHDYINYQATRCEYFISL